MPIVFIHGVPERAAMEMMGHRSACVNRAYAKKAKFVTNGLEKYKRAVATVKNSKTG